MKDDVTYLIGDFRGAQVRIGDAHSEALVSETFGCASFEVNQSGQTYNFINPKFADELQVARIKKHEKSYILPKNLDGQAVLIKNDGTIKMGNPEDVFSSPA